MVRSPLVYPKVTTNLRAVYLSSRKQWLRKMTTTGLVFMIEWAMARGMSAKAWNKSLIRMAPMTKVSSRSSQHLRLNHFLGSGVSEPCGGGGGGGLSDSPFNFM